MPLTTDVSLPRKHQARFPNRCVVCSCSNPQSSVRLITRVSRVGPLFLRLCSLPFQIKAPACTSCGYRLQLRRWLSLLMMTGLVVVAVFYLMPLVSEQWPWVSRRLLGAGLALLCGLPYILYEVFYPHPFNVTAHDRTIDYEFRDKELAYEFAELNRDAAWAKIRQN